MPGRLSPSSACVALKLSCRQKGLILWLFVQELDSPVAQDLCFVTLAAVGLLLEVGRATNFRRTSHMALADSCEM